MKPFRFATLMSLVFILALEGGLPPARAASQPETAEDFWATEIAPPKPGEDSKQQQEIKGYSTVTVQTTVHGLDGVSNTTQINVPEGVLPDGQKIQIEIENNGKSIPGYKEMLGFFEVLKEVTAAGLLENFEKGIVAAGDYVQERLYNRWLKAQQVFKEFPQEAFLFFIGMGFLTFVQLSFMARKDPAMIEHFLEHQFSSVGAIGFWFFMYANRESSALLSAALYGRDYRRLANYLRAQGNLHAEQIAFQQMNLFGALPPSAKFFSKFIPYLSMSVGFTMQNIVSTLIGDKNFSRCALISMGKTFNAAGEAVASSATNALNEMSNLFGQRDIISVPRDESEIMEIEPSQQVSRPAQKPLALNQSSKTKKSPHDDEDPCEKSFNMLVVKKKIYELTPGLLSMLGSTVVAGYVEPIIHRVVKKTYQKVTKAAANASGEVAAKLLLSQASDRTVKISLTGLVQLGFMATGVNGIILKSVNVISKLANIVLFTSIDQDILNSFVTKRWRNTFSASELGRVSSNLHEGILLSKINKWSPESLERFKGTLEKFSHASAEWREAQAMDSLMAHTNWLNPLLEVVNRYHASKTLYENMLKEATRYKLDPANSKFEKSLAIYGINPSTVSGDISTINPLMVPVDQYYKATFPTILRAYNVMELLLQKDYSEEVLKDKSQKLSYEFLTGHYNRMKPFIDQVKCTTPVYCKFPSVMDTQVIDLFVEQVSRLAYRIYERRDLKFFGYTEKFSEQITDIYNQLSLNIKNASLPAAERVYMRPRPQVNKGYWFVRAIQDYDPTFESFAEHAELPISTGGLYNRGKADYFFMNMICGPKIDWDQAVINPKVGFSPEFTPPSMVTNVPRACRSTDRNSHASALTINMPYDRHPLERQNGDENYVNMLDYFKENVDLQFLDMETSSPKNVTTSKFETWWQTNVYKPIEEKLKQWVLRYDDVSTELLQDIVGHDLGPWNLDYYGVSNLALRQGGVMPGPFSIRVREAMTQELRVYLMILGEVYKDLADKKDLPLSLKKSLVSFEPRKGAIAQVPVKFITVPNPTLLGDRAPELEPHLHPQGWRLLMSSKYDPNRVGSPLLWYTRPQDPLDFMTLAKPFETRENMSKLAASSQQYGNLLWQQLTLKAFGLVTDLFSKYSAEKSWFGNRRLVVSGHEQIEMMMLANYQNVLSQVEAMIISDLNPNLNHELIVRAELLQSYIERKDAFDDWTRLLPRYDKPALKINAAQSNSLIQLLRLEKPELFKPGQLSITPDQLLFIQELIKRMRALGESMGQMVSTLRMGDISAQINGAKEGKEKKEIKGNKSLTAPGG